MSKIKSATDLGDIEIRLDELIESMQERERKWLESLHPILRDAYLESRGRTERRLYNRIVYGVEDFEA